MKPRRFSQRLSLVIELPRFAREQILEKRKAWRKRLEQDVRWIPPLQLHLTLRYLGELEVSKSKLFCKRLDLLVDHKEPFQLSVDKVGASPSPAEATTLWLGFQRSGELQKLLGDIESLCRELSLPKDKKPFQPRIHLTRTSEPQAVPELQIKPDFKGFMVKNLSLVESRTGPTGLSYHSVRKFVLKGTESPHPPVTGTP